MMMTYTRGRSELPDGFEIDIGDDPSHEDLTAEISFCGEFVALITQELGICDPQIEWPEEYVVRCKICDLKPLLLTIDIALSELHRLRKD